HLEQGKLFIYNGQTKQMIGAFSRQNNKGTFQNPRGFGTGLVYGDEVILELNVPQESGLNDIIQISGIVHGYRLINVPSQYGNRNAKIASFGSSGACQVNVNCAEGTNWQDEKKGVAMILVDGNRLCTGSLINNTCNNGELYFLTADHCLQGKDAVTNPDA